MMLLGPGFIRRRIGGGDGPPGGGVLAERDFESMAAADPYVDGTLTHHGSVRIRNLDGSQAAGAGTGGTNGLTCAIDNTFAAMFGENNPSIATPTRSTVTLVTGYEYGIAIRNANPIDSIATARNGICMTYMYESTARRRLYVAGSVKGNMGTFSPWERHTVTVEIDSDGVVLVSSAHEGPITSYQLSAGEMAALDNAPYYGLFTIAFSVYRTSSDFKFYKHEVL